MVVFNNYFKKIFFFSVLIFATLVFGCRKKNKANPNDDAIKPIELSTTTVSSVSDSTALTGVTLISAGSNEITQLGVCWDTLPNPTTTKQQTVKGNSVGSYTVKLAGLKPGYNYFVRTYAVSDNGTAYGNEISFNTASRWVRADSSTMDNCFVNCLEAQGEHIYAGTNKGVFFSPDTGQTWTLIGLNFLDVTRMAVKEGQLFVAGYQQLYRSSDNGANWTSLSNKLPPGFYSTVDLLILDNQLLVSTNNGVFSSSDNGDSWQPFGIALPTNVNYRNLAKNNSYLFLTGNSSVSGNIQLFRIPLDGTDWELLNTGATLQNSTTYDLAACNEQVFFSATNFAGVYQSNNNGSSWLPQTKLPGNTLYFSTNGQVAFCCAASNQYYLWNSTTATWTLISNKGLRGGVPRAVAITPHYLLCTTLGEGVFRRKRWDNF